MTTKDVSTPNLPRSPRKKSSFAGDVAKLATGTVFAQLLGFLVTPILARLFAPEAFGLAALFASITSILIVIANMRYELAIMLPEDDAEAANLLALALIFGLLTTVITAVFIASTKNLIPVWLNEPAVGHYLWLVPVSVLFGGTFTALNYWNSRTKQFGRLSVVRIIRSVGTSSTQLGGGLLGHTTGGVMIGASVLGQIISSTVLGGQIWRDDRRLFRQNISWQGMVAGAKRYRRFPLFTTWSALLNSMSWQLPTFLLAFYFSPVVVGYYALGQRVLRVPMSLLGSSIGQVFFQRASQAKAEGNLALVVENTFTRLVRLGLFPSLMLTFVGKDLFVLLFGSEWAEAGVYVQILSIWTFFWFISSPLTTLVSILELQDWGLWFNFFIFISRIVALLIGSYLGNARLALMLFGISGILVYGCFNILLMSYAGVPYRRVIQILFYNTAISLPAGGLILIMILFNLNIGFIVFATFVISGICFSYIVHKDPELRKLFVGIRTFRKGK